MVRWKEIMSESWMRHTEMKHGIRWQNMMSEIRWVRKYEMRHNEMKTNMSERWMRFIEIINDIKKNEMGWEETWWDEKTLDEVDNMRWDLMRC